ncbi:hypothetical protein SAMN05446935_8479 [Burkholderia sp. YR290]|nr:hypothetical protein SAMN05446935_8479 [Burkholderia sp. YR290]
MTSDAFRQACSRGPPDTGPALKWATRDIIVKSRGSLRVDLAKNLIQIHGVDSTERVVLRKAISRQKFLEWFANLEPCLVAMEACSAAHY